MFAFHRSALAVLAPLALLLAVVLVSRQGDSPAPQQTAKAAADQAQTVAANLPSR